MKRYQALADTMAAEIRAGRLPVGTRLPSVRHLTTQYGVGQSTVFRAYYLLEEWGLIRARERSGYYVAPGAMLATLATLATQTPAAAPAPLADPAPIDVSSLVFSVLDAVKRPDVAPLGSAFPSPKLFPLQRLAKSLAHATRMLDPWSTVVDMPPGNEALRRQIALRYIGMGIAQPAEELIVTNGAMEALTLSLMAVTKPGDVVAIESPCFYAALQAVEHLGLRAIEIPVDPRDGLDLDVLAEALDKHPVRACWFMTNFQNPTGATLSIEKKRALVALLAKHEVPLIEDDVYGELHFAQDRPPPAKAFDTKGLVMHCASLSKTLAPGYRLGWVAAGRFADDVRRLKLMTTISTSIPIQAGIADFLQHGGFDKHLRKLRGALLTQRDAMEAAIARWLPEDVSFVRPDGGYFLWLKLAGHIDAMQLHREALGHGINVTPGPIFSARHAYGNYVRVNFGHPWSGQIEDAVRVLGELVRGRG
ncbi:aminotransferase-like domain-containing protein [Caballeronia insecticola]|nr:PLP-dependent aminotransferase family protein [Caballeronia insecticola]